MKGAISMKVIKEGKKRGIMRVTCATCEAELEITVADLNPVSIFFEITNFYYVCPCCRHKNCLNYKDLPEEIRFAVANK